MATYGYCHDTVPIVIDGVPLTSDLTRTRSHSKVETFPLREAESTGTVRPCQSKRPGRKTS